MLITSIFAFGLFSIIVGVGQPAKGTAASGKLGKLKNYHNLLTSYIQVHLDKQQGKNIRVSKDSVNRLIMENSACLQVPDPVKGGNLRKENRLIEDGIKWLGMGKAIAGLESNPENLPTGPGNFDSVFNLVLASVKKNAGLLHSLKKLEEMINTGEVRKKFRLFGDYELGEISTAGKRPTEVEEMKNCLQLALVDLNKHWGVEGARDEANKKIEEALNDIAKEMIVNPDKIKVKPA